MSIEKGASNWARSMRRAAARAQEHAVTWEKNYREGIADGPAASASPPPAVPGNPLGPEERKRVANYAAEAVGCFCDNLTQLSNHKKNDDKLVCTDVWLRYLNQEYELPELKKRIDAYYGDGSFEKAQEAARNVCPF